MEKEDELLELILDVEDGPILVEKECEEMKPIFSDFMNSYVKNQNQPIKAWLVPKMQEQLPDRNPKEIEIIVDEIIGTIQVSEEKRESLSKAINNGRSKESWFASEIKKSTSAMATQEAAKYLTDLDCALQQANDSLYRTITTQTGAINQNPRLDGFIAEQYHAQTFNLNAEASGSQYRAKVLEPNGKGYAKNSVDIVIVDGNDKVVKRYQSKYYKDAKATENAFDHGDYRGQQKLVPEEQQSSIQKKSSVVIESPDGITSKPLTKSRAEQMRDEAQSGNWNDLNWNEYSTKDLAIGIGKQAGYAALQGAAIGVGFDVAQKLFFVQCYSEKLILDKVRALAISGIVSCSLIVALMCALIFFIWFYTKKSSKVIRKLAYEDPITKGRNFNYFIRKAEELVHEHKEIPYLVQRFDISNFRYLNEAYGHDKADRILSIIVEQSRENFHGHELCVRMNSDQFVVLAQNSAEYTRRFAIFEDNVNLRAIDEGIKFPIRFKSGIYQVRRDDTDINVMVDRANVARRSLNADSKEVFAYYSDRIINDMRKVEQIEADQQNALINGEFKVDQYIKDLVYKYSV